MLATIHPSTISGKIKAPASKSSMQRACAAACVSAGRSVILNPGYSDDDKAALGIVESLGCLVLVEDGKMVIDSTNCLLHTADSAIRRRVSVNCGESGLSIRMFVPILGLCNAEVVVDGRGSLLRRPMDFFDGVLPQLGVQIRSNAGQLPLTMSGRLTPAGIEIDGSLSSQFLTGLLFAYAAADARNVTIRVRNLKSKPYVDLTLKIMQAFGLPIPQNDNYEAFHFPSTSVLAAPTQNICYQVEGDWSGAAFLLVAGAITGSISVVGLDVDSVQADRKILEALESCGSRMSLADDEISIEDGSRLHAFTFDATDCPDLFPPLVALAASCAGVTEIKGVGRLIHKESNRALALRDEFGKMGVPVDLNGDIMLITGRENVTGGLVNSHHDHRIAMACAVVALRAAGETTIQGADAINKSYPDFYEHLRLLGAQIEVNEYST